MQLSVEERAVHRGKVGELVANHKKELKPKTNQDKVQAKVEVKTALRDRKQQKAAPHNGADEETCCHLVVP